MTKKRKKELNFICQNCGKKRELEAAHIKGKDRKKIINSILKNYIINKNNMTIKVDLDLIEKEILEAHKPIDRYFKFLCHDCHIKYDKE